MGDTVALKAQRLAAALAALADQRVRHALESRTRLPAQVLRPARFLQMLARGR